MVAEASVDAAKTVVVVGAASIDVEVLVVGDKVGHHRHQDPAFRHPRLLPLLPTKARLPRTKMARQRDRKTGSVRIRELFLYLS